MHLYIIIIRIGDKPWSKIGADAALVKRARRKEKQEPTMMLRFLHSKSDDDLEDNKENIAYNNHIIIHEFGHALGMEHEHQRSKFWFYAKDFIDLDKMKRGLGMSDKELQKDYGECPAFSTEDGSDYDPESVMHYW